MEARKSAGLKRVYYDWDDQLKTNESGNTQYTPINQTLWGLRASLDLLIDEGFENTIKRHHRWACKPHNLSIFDHLAATSTGHNITLVQLVRW